MPACAVARRTPATAGMSGTCFGARGEIEVDIARSGVMPGLVPGIHEFGTIGIEDVDGTRNSGLPELRNYLMPQVGQARLAVTSPATTRTIDAFVTKTNARHETGHS